MVLSRRHNGQVPAPADDSPLCGPGLGVAAAFDPDAATAAFDVLADLVGRGGVVVVSGAGLSTESGIPDYRGPTGRTRRATPMTYQTFVGDPAARRRYWARSQRGWRHVACAQPNPGHRAVAELERRGLVGGIITQNVDGLHQVAGARRVVELHGSLARVVCLDCGGRSSRAELDHRLRAANPRFTRCWLTDGPAAVNPDGDAVVGDDEAATFRVVDCADCGGMLKPDVVFFGENVPRSRVAACSMLVERAGALVVLGSSLTVMSGYRFVRDAARRRIPVAIVNQGATRGDRHAVATLDAPLGRALTALVDRLAARPAALQAR